MKNLSAILTLSTTVLLVPIGILISKVFIQPCDKKAYSENKEIHIDFDNSLRNFHPNKGE